MCFGLSCIKTGTFITINGRKLYFQNYSKEGHGYERKTFESYLEERENAEATIKKYLRDVGTFRNYLKGEDQAGIRPDSIEVKLWAGKTLEATQTVDESDGWT